MKKNVFDEEYNKYWKKRVENSIDGSKVPGEEIISNLISTLEINKKDTVLDLGCGYGRIFAELNKYTSKIWGIDIDISMINDASKLPYHSLHKATAENTNFPDNYFDRIIALGVFDVVNQEESIFELCRILKTGGLCMFTGKNIDYFDDDDTAFIAERNAKLNDFPNHFTNVNLLIDKIREYGFLCERLIVFPKRGDFGENRKILVQSEKVSQFYEYCIYLKKEREIAVPPSIKIASEFSSTAYRKYKSSNCKTIIDFFKTTVV